MGLRQGTPCGTTNGYGSARSRRSGGGGERIHEHNETLDERRGTDRRGWGPAWHHGRCGAGPPEVDARLRTEPADGEGTPGRREVGCLVGRLERRRQELRIRARWQTLPVRRRHEAGRRGWSGAGGRSGRHGTARTGWPCARTTGRDGRVAGHDAEGRPQEPQPVCLPDRRLERIRGDDRRLRDGPDQVRHGELGLRGRTVADDGDVVVA